MRKLRLKRTKLFSCYRKSYRFLLRCIKSVLIIIFLYFVVILIGLIPINNNFQASADGIEIHFVSSSVHADIILPINTDTIKWDQEFASNSFASEMSSAKWIAFGWGDRGFFTQTPTWADLKFSTAVKALLLPSEACMRVYFFANQFLPENVTSVRISVTQYEQLVEYIKSSFRRTKDGNIIIIPDVTYGFNNAFFEAHGTYNCFNTCNSWIGRTMQYAGIRTAWFTPLPKTFLFYLPK